MSEDVARGPARPALTALAARIPRKPALFAVMAVLICLVGLLQSWSLALAILNLCLISAIMTLGVNIQWGYAGLFNAGVMGFAALGGLAGVLVSMPPVAAAWRAGGAGVLVALACAVLIIAGVAFLRRRIAHPGYRRLAVALLVVGGYAAARAVFGPAVEAIEAVDPTTTGYLGGFGLPIVLSWLVGGALAAGAAWICKISLSLRSDAEVEVCRKYACPHRYRDVGVRQRRAALRHRRAYQAQKLRMASRKVHLRKLRRINLGAQRFG